MAFDAVGDAAIDAPDESTAQRISVNGGFEEPVLGYGFGYFGYVDASTVPGWETTDSTNTFEIWESGWGEVPSAEGYQFVEVNVVEATSVFQDVATRPGARVRWKLSHRGRTGVDTLEIQVGPPQGALVMQASVSTGMTAWMRHEGDYIVPAAQTVTRFQFQAANPAGSSGNFLDDVVILAFP